MASNKVAFTLMRFAKARENALRAVGALGMAKAQAIQKIINVAGYFRDKSQEVQLRAVRQIEFELMLILPHENSRFQNQRKQILELIEKSHD